MKVALVHMRYGLKGGLETRLHNYVRYFLDRGDKVTVYTTKLEEGVRVPVGVEVVMVDVKRIPKPIRPLFFAKQVSAIMKSRQFDFSLSLSRTHSEHMVIAANTHKGYLKALGKRFTNPSDWMQAYLDRKSFENSKVVLACSQMVKDEVIELYGIPEEKVKVLYPPLNDKLFNQQQPESKYELKKRFGLSPDKQTLLFVSTSHQRKGFDLLEKVMTELKELPVELAVAGSPFTPSLPNIKSLGFVKDMPGLYTAADITIHPATYEPFGQIVSESLACGTPAVVSGNTGAKEVITTQTGRIVQSFAVEEWRSAVTAMLNSDHVIPANWATVNELTLEQHMEKMLGWR